MGFFKDGPDSGDLDGLLRAWQIIVCTCTRENRKAFYFQVRRLSLMVPLYRGLWMFPDTRPRATPHIPGVLTYIHFFFNIFNVYLFNWERDQSGAEWLWSRLCAVNAEPNVVLSPTNSEIMTWAKIKSRTLNRLSHPGTLTFKNSNGFCPIAGHRTIIILSSLWTVYRRLSHTCTLLTWPIVLISASVIGKHWHPIPSGFHLCFPGC